MWVTTTIFLLPCPSLRYSRWASLSSGLMSNAVQLYRNFLKSWAVVSGGQSVNTSSTSAGENLPCVDSDHASRSSDVGLKREARGSWLLLRSYVCCAIFL